MSFEAEQPVFILTLIVSATLSAGDPVTAAGAKASDAQDFYGIAITNAVSGDAIPVLRWGVVAVVLDSSSSGVVAGDRITYATDGFDAAGQAQGFAVALDAGAASGTIRIDLGSPAPAEGAALTAIDAATIDATYDSVEQGVLNNVRTRLNELEARLQALGLIL